MASAGCAMGSRQQTCRVAVVTGANKGIGFEIARQLAQAGVLTILTSRDEVRGRAAANALKDNMNCDSGIEFHQLDVTDLLSIATLVKWIQHKFGKIDILVNNAAVLGEVVPGDRVSSGKVVLDTNFYGVKQVTEAFFPILHDRASVVNVSSEAGILQWLPQKWRNVFAVSNTHNLSMEMLEEFICEFMEDLEKGDAMDKWPQIPFWTSITDYSVSKVALNTYTRILARDDPRVSVNCMSPGYTRTGMTQNCGDHGPEHGAETAVWLALTPPLPHQSGYFFRDKSKISFEVFQELEAKYLESL